MCQIRQCVSEIYIYPQARSYALRIDSIFLHKIASKGVRKIQQII